MSVKRIRPFLLTSVGRKYLMGATGLLWALFVLAHMLGNFLLFVGSDAYNSYSHFLTHGYIIYVIEGLLIFSIVSHLGLAISLTAGNLAARGSDRYAAKPSGPKSVSLTSRTMGFQGTLILAFILSHIATFKYGPYYEATVNGIVMRDIFRLVLEIFKQPGYLIWYTVSLIVLGFHLSHGVGSIFQSFGIRADRYSQTIKWASVIYALVVGGGFLIQPFYVYFISMG